MTLNTEKLTSFAQAVGSDIKEIKTTLASKADKSEIGQVRYHTTTIRYSHSRCQNSHLR